MPAIKSHKTPVDKTGEWDGPKAVADAPAEAAILRYMHAWVDAKGDESKKASYKFPHHEPGTDTAAVIKGVNNALARLPQANIPNGDRAGVEAHLRKHRKDAGLEEAMSESEIHQAVKWIKEADDLKAEERQALLEAVRLQEKSNLGEWLESRLHLNLTQLADDLFGGGNVTRQERKALSGAIGQALDSYHQFLADNAPQLFERRPWDDAPAEDGNTAVTEGAPEGISAVLQEALSGDYVPLIEKAVSQDGTVPIKIIQPGWGSTGYYPVEVLKRDGTKAFPIGTKMFWNHPTRSEESDRPERDLNDLAAELVSAASFQDNGPAGPGLYAKAKVFQKFQPAVDDLAESIGLSIRAAGKLVAGTAEGRNGPIISEITPDTMNTVDFITYPGAGGEIVNLFEAARAVRTDSQPATTSERGVGKEEVDMTPEELKQLQETNATLQRERDEAKAENARLQEATILREAKDLVGTILAKTTLPEATKARLSESLVKAATVKEGKLDKEAFEKQVAEAVKAEVKYLTEVAGLGNITGLGESADADPEEADEKIQESLAESFQAIGLSETAAKKAAKGRG
jgi:hypothetical protein